MIPKVCLVYPNQFKLPVFFDRVTNISSEPTLLPPLGMLYLISNSKYKIDFIDNRVKKYSEKELLDYLLKYDVVGFGGTIFEVPEAINLSLKLRKKNIVTIYGGPNATVNADLYIDKFSIIFRGEGELILDEIIDKVREKNLEKLKDIEKYEFIKKSTTYYNLNIIRINELDKLKFPDRKILLNEKKYKRNEYEFLSDLYPVDTVCSSRGCPFDCSFCSSKHIWQRKYTMRSVDNVIEEIIFLKENYNTKGIYFREDNFTVSKKRVLEFCKKVRQLEINWLCESRIDTLDEKILTSMKESGCSAIWFGIESTSCMTQKLIKKNINIENVLKITSLCRKLGIKTGGGFIIGFPNETKLMILETLNRSKTLGFDTLFYNRLWAIPKSELYQEIINEKLNTYEINDIIIPATKYLTADEVTDLYYNFLYNKNIRFLKKIIPQKIVDYLNYNFHPLYEKLRQILN